MLKLNRKSFWMSPAEGQLSDDEFVEQARVLIDKNSSVYVGTDSMLRGDTCIFATVIAFHNNAANVATYYYKKFKVCNAEYKNIKNKITEEVNLSVQAAQVMSNAFPMTPVEVHVDIGASKENKTRIMMSTVSGWVAGMGYDLKIKPDSWASSSIADWHTK